MTIFFNSGGFRPNYASLDFRTGHKTDTSYVQHPQNLGLLGNCAASLACVPPPNHMRYAQHQQQQQQVAHQNPQNPFAAAVAALGLQQPGAQFGGPPRGLFDTRFGTAPRHGGAQQQHSAGGQQQQAMSLLQAPHQPPPNIMHQQTVGICLFYEMSVVNTQLRRMSSTKSVRLS